MGAPVRLRAAAGCALAFVVLTVVIALHPTIGGDHALSRRLLTQPGTLGWHVAVLVSFIASGPVVALCGALAAGWTAWRLRRPAAAIAIVAAPLIAAIVEIATKSLVGRPRPLTAALSGESGNGYPSGHVSGFSALVVVLFVVWVAERPGATPRERRRWALVVACAIVIVGWSRIAIGAHFASDVVGGALLGVSVGLSCAWFADVAGRSMVVRGAKTRPTSVDLPSADAHLNQR